MANRQQGAALLFFFLLIGIGLLALFATGIDSNKTRFDRDAATTRALAQAKDALISWSAAQGTLTGTARPGELPCPDTNNSGFQAASCTAGARGRIPWKTLGMPEPKDAYGETLWYAVSGPFRKYSVNSNPIDSDTKATLKVYAVDGTTLLTPVGGEATAVIFSAGPPVAGQLRGTAAQINAAANYLDSSSGRNNATTGGPYIAGTKTDSFNDTLVFITAKELMSVVEKRVAREVMILLGAYYNANTYYPYPAAYNAPNCLDTGGGGYLTQCTSDATKCRGRLPQTATTGSTPDWSAILVPDWLSYNLWHQVIYYGVGTSGLQASPAGCSAVLTVDSATSAKALFFMPGPPLGALTRPSTSLSTYLEDPANQDGWTSPAPAADSYVTPTSISNDSLYILP